MISDAASDLQDGLDTDMNAIQRVALRTLRRAICHCFHQDESATPGSLAQMRILESRMPGTAWTLADLPAIRASASASI